MDLIAAEGHQIAKRPTVSPDMGAIELCFNVIRTFLCSHWLEIELDNLVEYIEHGICSITGRQCRGFFYHTGY